jgi:Fe-S-cluster containining protein
MTPDDITACEQYLEKKKALIAHTIQALFHRAAAKGDTISCKIGCIFCCTQYIRISAQEAHSIVCWLDKNPDALKHFLETYPLWLKKFRAIQAAAVSKCEGGQPIFVEVGLYNSANIHCPFLKNNECVIYEARPYACAGYFATSPVEYCNYANPNEPEILTPEDENEVEGAEAITQFPLNVYEILTTESGTWNKSQ